MTEDKSLTGGREMKIIVIDDEAAALNTFFMGIVDKTDFSYQMFYNDPLASIEYVKKNRVDAAFLDINMPVINGVDLAEKLVEAHKTIGIVFISGYAHDEDSFRKRLGGNLIGFCYKPYDLDTLNMILNTVKAKTLPNREICIKTFGSFDIFIDGEPIKFTGRKSKELLALLVDRNGGYVTIENATSLLWQDSLPENGKRLYRDAVYKLRKDLSKANLDIVEYSWGKLRLTNLDIIQCDYWDYLKHNTRTFAGSYLPSYDWSVETQMMLENKYTK